MQRTCGCGADFTKTSPKRPNKCPACVAKDLADWKARNPDHAKRAKQNAKARDPQKFRAGKAAFARGKKQRIIEGRATVMDIMRLLVARTKNASRTRARPIEVAGLTAKVLLSLWQQQGGLCALSGMTMTLDRQKLKSVSLDRKDSGGNYTPDNVQLVCKWVNFAKNNHSDTELLELLSEYQSLVLSRHGVRGIV